MKHSSTRRRAMKAIGKAAEFPRKAAAALRGKAAVLRARLLFLASLRRRAAVLAGISRHIRALSPGQRKAAGARAMVFPRPVDDDVVDGDNQRAATPARTRDDGFVVGMAELASLFVQEVDEDGDGGSHQDWTLALRSLFDEKESHGYGDEEHRAGDDLDDEVEEGFEDDGDEPSSVIDLIRGRREGEGKEFGIDDEIDQAADMFITRVRRRMAAHQPELGVSGLH